MNDAEQIRKLAVTLGALKEYKCKGTFGNGNCAIQGPFDMIAGVKNIDTRFSFYNNYTVLDFEISINFKRTYDRDNHMIFRHNIFNRTGIDQDDILKFSTEVYEVIPKLKLDIDGFLRVPDLIKLSISEALNDVFSSIECESVTVTIFDKCPVCFDKTETKTDCKHPLCYKCWADLKTCPVCRAEFNE